MPASSGTVNEQANNTCGEAPFQNGHLSCGLVQEVARRLDDGVPWAEREAYSQPIMQGTGPQ
jgi:hypothetical protein